MRNWCAPLGSSVWSTTSRLTRIWRAAEGRMAATLEDNPRLERPVIDHARKVLRKAWKKSA